MTLRSLPQARIVRNAGHLVAAPRAPRNDEPSWLGGHLRTAVQVAIGLWPLTCVVLLVAGFLVLAGHAGPGIGR